MCGVCVCVCLFTCHSDRDHETMALLEEIIGIARTTNLHPPLQLRFDRVPDAEVSRFRQLQRECAWVHLSLDS